MAERPAVKQRGQIDHRGYHTSHKALRYANVSEVATLCADCGLEGVDLCRPCSPHVRSLRSALAKCREETVAECAKVALGHKGRAAQERRTKTLKHSHRFMSEEMYAEIQAEERGEDIAAEEIAKAIRALASTGEKR
jgi:hypothetical protein